MKRLIGRIFFPRLTPDQVDRKVMECLLALGAGLVGAIVAVSIVIQRYIFPR